MFGGIVQALASVSSIQREQALMSLTLSFPVEQLSGLRLGASVAVNGVCLTVTVIAPPLVSFDMMEETQQRTTLASLQVGEEVHIERSLCYGEEIGGHPIWGHVQTTATVLSAQFIPGKSFLRVGLPAGYSCYLAEKGFVALHGVSLTVCEPEWVNSSFQVNLIPETLRRTIFSRCALGDRLNVEFDPYWMKRVDALREEGSVGMSGC